MRPPCSPRFSLSSPFFLSSFPLLLPPIPLFLLFFSPSSQFLSSPLRFPLSIPHFFLLIMSASCSALRRLTHRSPRTLLPSSRSVSVSRFSPASSISRSSLTLPRQPSQVSRFSTMSALQSAAPPAPANRAYDPEIKDMADYIHKYKVDSDLAVCFPFSCQLIFQNRIKR